VIAHLSPDVPRPLELVGALLEVLFGASEVLDAGATGAYVVAGA
jgi:hypothetical protein